VDGAYIAFSPAVLDDRAVCGIAGLFAKDPEVESTLGTLLAGMLITLGERGPDSTGFAIYGDAVATGWSKLSLRAREPGVEWAATERALAEGLGNAELLEAIESHALVSVAAEPRDAARWVRESGLPLQVVSTGTSIEMFKETGTPEEVVELFSLAGRRGSHGLGHTRMATESRITTDGSHPFSTGPDLCLVHNGSLSNHNRLREELRRRGLDFETENDSEVAAGYLTSRLEDGATLDVALEGCLDDLDGFYTFAVGTASGFAVLRDPIACKPAVMAETGAWVAMASEYRAIATLPGAEDARVWEPAPGQVYHWDRARVA
jgi:methylamine---glutamate N-methyltransferase subunit A